MKWTKRICAEACVIAFLIIIVMGLNSLIDLWVGWQRSVIKIADHVTTEQPLLSVRELQERLRNGGYYNGPIDGRCGPNTKAAWDKAINQQFAEKWEVE